MPGVARIGDVAGGPILTGRANVLANGIPVAGIGDAISPHGRPPHTASVIVSGSPLVLAGGIPVARIGDAASCGHVIASGSPNVMVG